MGKGNVPDDKSKPQLRIMLPNSRRNDKLRPNNISHAIRHENRRRHETLLRCPCHIGHADTDDQTDHRAKESDDRVARYRGGCVVRPCALPDHGAASYDGETAEDEEDETDVGETGGEVAR